jgi:hypothetical protein
VVAVSLVVVGPVIVSTIMIVPIPINLSSYCWNQLIDPTRITVAPVATVRGRGLLFTI